MKITTFNWAGSAKNLPDWFKHNETIEVADVWEAVKELYATGNNVMISHSRDGEPIVFVDDRRFTQR